MKPVFVGSGSLTNWTFTIFPLLGIIKRNILVMQTQNFFFVPSSSQDEKHLSLYL